jgi:pimeloyl-ACP methyl ester carboxylesterase
MPAPPVLLIPGLDGDPGLLAGAAPGLFPELRTLVFDHLRDPADDGVEGLANRALALLDAEAGVGAPAYVCGESFGGTVALTLARRHPERVRGLIMLSAFGWYPAVSTYTGQLGMAAWRLFGDRFAALALRIWRPVSAPGALGFRCPRGIARAYLRRPALHLSGYRAKCAISLTFDARPWLHEIACPTFVLVGTWDPVVPTRAGRELARRIPNAQLCCLPGSHLVHVLRAKEVGAQIARWMRSADGSSGHGS